MIMFSSTSSNVQLFHYDCRVILFSIQSLSRMVLRWCCTGGAMMMPEMILICGFRVAGILIWEERLLPDTREREYLEKINRSFVFNCLGRGGFGLSSHSLLPHSLYLLSILSQKKFVPLKQRTCKSCAS